MSNLREKAFKVDDWWSEDRGSLTVVSLEDALAAVEEAKQEHLATRWPPRSVVETLITAVDHLLKVHDCDTNGHEQFKTAKDAAWQWLTDPRLASRPAPEGEVGALVEEAKQVQLPSDRHPLLVEVYYASGDDPFICGINGPCTVTTVEEIERDLKDDPDFLRHGDGTYLFSAAWDSGQFDELGRCELPPYWDLTLITFQKLGEEAKNE